MKTSKMIYVRHKDGSAVSILTEVDWETGDMDWAVSMCNKQDRFEKKIAIDLCKNKPFMNGTTAFSVKYVERAKSKAPNFRSYQYLNSVAINALLIASERVNRIPVWANDMLMEEYFNTTSDDIFGWDF